ncbi:MAG: RluA family pseudouridine synthase [Planctomycetaceae bacterium]|nr:RluA family pseudouridine synthase [Planctomycetaceae bacterium]
MRVAVQVERYLSGVRVDTFLARHFRNYTPFRLMRLVTAGLVQIEGATAETVQRVHTGQRVTVCLLEPPDKLLEPEAGPLDVLYEDSQLLAVCKPAGQIVHPVGQTQTGTLANRVQAHLDALTPLRGLLRPGIVHRLDRETSGVIVVPVEHAAHRSLSIQFQQGEIEKTYLALVEGSPAQDSGTIDLPLGTWPGGQSILVSAAADARNPRPAVTRYTVRERFEKMTLIEARPLTGRIHQIRVHLATMGHPVVADEYYGMGGSLRVPHAGSTGSLRGVEPAGRPLNGTEPLMQRHALHAWQLTFTHPVTGNRLTVEAPLTDDFQQALNLLRGQVAGPP